MKKNLALILEIIPIISTAAFFFFTYSDMNPALVKTANTVAVIFSLLGIPAFIAGRILAKGSKPALILGILDLLCTAAIIVFYILAIFVFGL